MIFYSERISDIDFIPLVRLERLDLSYSSKLGYLVVIFSLIHSQVSLLELFRYVTEFVQQWLDIYNLFLLDVCSFEDLIRRAEIALSLRHGA